MPRRRSLPDNLRCRRSDGRHWRCSSPSLPGSSLCSHHLSRHRTAAISPSPPPPPRRRKRRPDPDPSPTVKEEPADEEAEEAPPPPPPPPKRRRGRHAADSGEQLPDHLRCRRSDGKKWRCPGRALPSVSFCEYHYAQAKRNEARVKKGPSPPPPPLPADGELLVAALRRQAEKKKKRKHKQMKLSVVPAVSGLTRDLPNGLMTISPVDSGGTALALPVQMKVGFEKIVRMRRCYRSKNAEPVPIGPLKEFPGGMGLTKVARRICHRCGRKNAARIVKCLSCANQFFCLSCIKKWYAGMSKKDIKMCCPVCRHCCNCKQCTLGETEDAMCKESASDQDKLVKIKYAEYLFCQLLPVLKINQEQIDELEIEAKIQGTKISNVRIHVAESGRSEPFYCNNCKLSVHHFLRSCPKCSFKLCLSCCQKIREGNMVDSIPVDTTVVCKKKRTKKSISSTTLGIKQQFSAPVFPDDGCKSTQPLLQCESRHEDGSILCPSNELGGCGNSLLSLIYTFPSVWSEELSIGAQRKASSCNYAGMIDVLPHCSSLVESNDNLARFAISRQETLAT